MEVWGSGGEGRGHMLLIEVLMAEALRWDYHLGVLHCLEKDLSGARFNKSGGSFTSLAVSRERRCRPLQRNSHCTSSFLGQSA